MRKWTCALAVLLLCCMMQPLQGQTGWRVDGYQGFRASINNQGAIQQVGWVNSNLGNAWDEGEWVPYVLTLQNVNMGNVNFSPIRVSYDFTGNNPGPRFVDLVRGLQVGITGKSYFPLASGATTNSGWPMANGTPYILNTAAQLQLAQGDQDENVWGSGSAAPWLLLNLPNNQVNRDLTTTPLPFGSVGTVTDAKRCFTITRQDLLNIGIPATYTGTMQIYFCLHLSQTFVWSLSLQDQFNVPPIDDWGGYVYGLSPFDTDIRNGAGYVSGASGHTELIGPGSRTVSIPVPAAAVGEISGIKFFDRHADGAQNGGDPVLEGWDIHISTIIGGVPISYVRTTSAAGAYSLTGLPGAVYLVSEMEQGPKPTGGTPPPPNYPNYPYPAFSQTNPSDWGESYPAIGATLNNGATSAVATTPGGLALGYAPVTWAVDLVTTPVQGGINFGNFVLPPECAVTPDAVTVCEGTSVSFTASRTANGTPPYTVAWTGPNGFTSSDWSITVTSGTNTAGTYSAVLTDFYGLTSTGCTATLGLYPQPECSISPAPASAPTWCEGTQLTLTGPLAGGGTPNTHVDSWTWSVSGNATIIGDNDDSTVLIQAGALPNGTQFTVTLTTKTSATEGECTTTCNYTYTISPLLTCPADLSIACTDPVPLADVGLVTVGCNVTGLSITATDATTSYTAASCYVITRTYSTIINGTTVSCAQMITVYDDIAPTWTTAASSLDRTVECDDAPSLANAQLLFPVATDNCDTDVSNIVRVAGSFVPEVDCPQGGSYTNTWTVTDECGNTSAVYTQVITVVDTQAPTFTRPADLTIYRDASCGYDASVMYTGDVTDEADNCGVGQATFIDQINAANPCSVIITRTWSLVDYCGNAAANQVQTITVEDNTPPTFTRPVDITIYRDANCGYDASVTATGDVTNEADNCGVGEATFVDQVNATNPCSVVITRTWSLVDNCGNAAANQVQTITVEDNTPPTFTRPADITIYRDANCIYDATVTATGDVTDEADNCGVGQATFADQVNATNPCSVIITRTWSLVDNCGNAAADQVQTITVEDNTPPTFTRPIDITIYRDANCGYDASVTATGDVTNEADNCGVGEATFADQVNATNPCSVIITRTWSLVDNCGNAAADQIQTITVEDNTPPTFTRPIDITIYRDANCGYDASLTATGDVTDEADNCGVGEATYADQVNATDPCSVIITRTWSLVDNCGNAAANQVQTITVEDNTPPTFTRPIDITIYRDANCGYDASVTATGDVTDEADNCGVGQATFADQINAADPCSVIITRTWSLVDNCGNAAANQVQTITVEDNTPPTFTRPADITIYRDANCSYDASLTATGDVTNEADNCGVGEATYADNVNTSNPCSVIITRTWSLVDNCGNAAADQVQIITVEDNTPPTFTHPADITIYRDANCSYDASVTATGDVTNEADNCGVGEATFADQVNATNPCSVIITRTWSLVDNCGNAAADQIQTITVEDNTPPTFTRPADITIYRDANCAYDVSVAATGDVTNEADNCGVGEATFADLVNATNPCSVIITRTWSLVDNCGNAAANQVQTITVEDNTPPTFTRPIDITIYRDANCNYDATVSITGDVTDEADNCGVGQATYVDTDNSGGSCSLVITRTWSLVDNCGNAAADQIQTITVLDNTDPVLVGVPADVTVQCHNTPTAPTVTATDNCDSNPLVSMVEINTQGTDPTVCSYYSYTITRTWTATDACSNSSIATQVITVQDTEEPLWINLPPNGPVNGIVVDCATDPIPFWVPVLGTDYNDNCDLSPTLSNPILHDIIPQPDGTKWHIRSWLIVDACGNQSSVQTQTIIESRCQFASLTQGYYGNAGGTYCGTGQTTLALLNNLLTTPIIVGLSGQSFTIGTGDASCLIQRLPSGGTAAVLQSNNYSFNPNCSITPGNFSQINNGKFSNILLGQTITFALNLRLDPHLTTDVKLPPTTLPYLWTIESDYVNGICLDGDDVESSVLPNTEAFYIPPSVITALYSVFPTATNLYLPDLLAFANMALAGQNTYGATLAEITMALDAYNKGFDKARFFAGYHAGTPKAAPQEAMPGDFTLHQNHPNPFNPTTTISFTIPEDCSVRLTIHNSLGMEVDVLLDRSVMAGTHAIPWNVNAAKTILQSGVYTYRIHAVGADGVEYHDVRKMMLVK